MISINTVLLLLTAAYHIEIAIHLINKNCILIKKHYKLVTIAIINFIQLVLKRAILEDLFGIKFIRVKLQNGVKWLWGLSALEVDMYSMFVCLFI